MNTLSCEVTLFDDEDGNITVNISYKTPEGETRNPADIRLVKAPKDEISWLKTVEECVRFYRKVSEMIEKGLDGESENNNA